MYSTFHFAHAHVSFCRIRCPVCCTVGVTIRTSSSRCDPRPRTSLLGSSIGNSADLFKPRLVSASSGAVCMGSPEPRLRSFSTAPRSLCFCSRGFSCAFATRCFSAAPPTVFPIQSFQCLDFIANLCSLRQLSSLFGVCLCAIAVAPMHLHHAA